MVSDELSKYFARIGSKGGRSVKARKLAAVRRNLRKANAARKKINAEVEKASGRIRFLFEAGKLTKEQYLVARRALREEIRSRK